MGNSTTSSPCGQSQQQILQDNFNKFNVPTNFLTPNESVQRNGNVFIAQGKQKIKGNLFTTKNIFNIVDSKSQISRYYERLQGKDSQEFPFVKIHGVKQMQQNNLCSSWKWYYVITENIIPFDQISTGLTFQECVFILFEALMGFFYLYAKNRSFTITQKMIGINSEGKIKVWLHQNYGQNHPESQTIQLYLTKNYKSENQEQQRQGKYILQRQMIRQILNILNKKFIVSQNTFEMTLRKRIREFIKDFSIKRCGFKDLLEALSIFEQKSGDKLYIPNRLKLQKEYVSKLVQRESFSQKLQRAISKYNAQIIAMRQQEQKTFSTGRNGNSMLKQSAKQQPLVVQRPQVRFNQLTPWKLTEQNSKGQLVRYAESEMIGMGGSYNQRLEEFNYRPYQQQRLNINTYVPGDYENEIEMLSKDMRDTYFQSTGDSRSYLLKSRSITQFQKLSRSHSESQNMYQNSHYTPVTFSNSIFIASEEKNMHRNPSNKFSYDLMQINEEHEAKQESIRPSLMSINVDGKSSLDNRSKDRPNQKINYKLSDTLQPIDQQRRFNSCKQGSPQQYKYQEKRFFVSRQMIDNITDRLKSEPTSL